MLKIIRRKVLVKFIVIFLLFIPVPLILAGECYIRLLSIH